MDALPITSAHQWRRETLALANVGNRFPTWEEILLIVALDVLLITGALLLFRRSLRRSRRDSAVSAAASKDPRGEGTEPPRRGPTGRDDPVRDDG